MAIDLISEAGQAICFALIRGESSRDGLKIRKRVLRLAAYVVQATLGGTVRCFDA